MIPKLNRGHSFIALTKYLTHDKREAGQADADSAERVGFCHTTNFAAGQAANDPGTAARLMALTWQSREQLKQAAGIKPGGSVSKGPPVWHTSLSWAKGETPDRAEKMRAVDAYLTHMGLGADKGFQTIIVEHTDTAHPHVHVVVNLVHPDTGKQADPFRDQQRAQAWARDYEKQRGAVFCHDREAKHAAADKARASHATPSRAAFNDNAKGGMAKAPTGSAGSERTPRTRPARAVPYQTWKAQQEARAEREQAAAAQVKATLGERYTAMRAGHDAAFQKRQAELAQFRADRQGGRNAIYEKYATALDAVWKPQPGPKEASPERSAWAKVHATLAAREAAFVQREGGFFGQLMNALDLAKGRNQPNFLRILFDPNERRRLFDREQRRVTAKLAPRMEPKAKGPPQPRTPDLTRVRAAQIKDRRTAELAAYDRRQAAAAASMEARHDFAKEAEQGQRVTFKEASKAAWAEHRQAFAPDREQDNARPASRRQAAQKADLERPAQPDAEAQPEAKADRFGRSRDRKPRQPRQSRAAKEQATADSPASPENRGKEAGEAFDRVNTPAAPEATQTPELGQGGTVSGAATDEDAAIAARVAEIRAERAAARERGNDLDTSRTMGR